MVDLMKTFMLLQNCPFIPQLTREIPNFKAWVNGYLNNDLNVIVSKCIEFWKLGMSRDNSYCRVMGACVKYWENILELLSRSIHIKILFYWKVFGLLAIGKLIVNAHPFLPL
jgi:hypothetical protein